MFTTTMRKPKDVLLNYLIMLNYFLEILSSEKMANPLTDLTNSATEMMQHDKEPETAFVLLHEKLTKPILSCPKRIEVVHVK